jgi:hypothetical protein
MNKYIASPSDFVKGAIKNKRSVISVLGLIGGAEESQAVDAVLHEILSQEKSALVVSQKDYDQGSDCLADYPLLGRVICGFDSFIDNFGEYFNSSEFNAVVFTMGEPLVKGFLKKSLGHLNIFDLLDRLWLSELVFLSVDCSSPLSVGNAYEHADNLIKRFEGASKKVRVLCRFTHTYKNGDVHYRFEVYNLYEFIKGANKDKSGFIFLKLGYQGESLKQLLLNKLRIYKG